MHYYDHHHDPNTHLQLARQCEDELLGAARRRQIRPGLIAHLRTLLNAVASGRLAHERATRSEAKNAPNTPFSRAESGAERPVARPDPGQFASLFRRSRV